MLRPFQKTLRRDGTEVAYSLSDFEVPELDDDDGELDANADDDGDGEGSDEDVDILAEMSEEERELALGQMQAVKETISKV